jgi:hypothetical protein
VSLFTVRLVEVCCQLASLARRLDRTMGWHGHNDLGGASVQASEDRGMAGSHTLTVHVFSAFS